MGIEYRPSFVGWDEIEERFEMGREEIEQEGGNGEGWYAIPYDEAGDEAGDWEGPYDTREEAEARARLLAD